MADRFPLIVNETSRRIEEIISGDNLDLTNNGISISSNTGNAGDYLQSTGSGLTWTTAGDVYLDATQTLTNKTLESCIISGASNTISGIENSSIVNSFITINGTAIALGGSATTPNDDTTYSVSVVDGASSSQKGIRLTAGGSGSGNDDVFIGVTSPSTIPAGQKAVSLYIDRSGDSINLSATAEDADTITRFRGGTTGLYVDGDVTLTASGSSTVTQVGNTINVESTYIDTITELRGTTSGVFTSGQITFTNSGATTITQSQSGTEIDISSVDTISRLRATGANGGSYFSGDFDLIPGTNVDLVQSNNTVTINSSFTNTVTSLKEDTSGTFQTGNIVFLGSGATTVTQGTDGNGDTTFTISSINSDTGATLNASGGLILQGTNFRLRNYNNLDDSTIMKWDNSNDQLTNSIITDDGSTVTVDGDLIVTGATSTIESQTVVIADSQIELRKGNNLTGVDAGIQVNRTTNSSGIVTAFNSLLWTEVGGYWRSYDGSVSHRFVTENESQILTNKQLTSPVLTTPSLGAATATSINGLLINQTANANLSVASNKTFSCNNTLTLTGTDTASINFNNGGTVAYRTDKLSSFANTTSSELRGIVTDETGAGSLVFNTSPSITSSIVTGSNSFDVFNTTALTINAFGAATTINIGDATGTTTFPGAVVIEGATTLGDQNGDVIDVVGVLDSVNNDIIIRGSSLAPMRIGRGNNAIDSNTAVGFDALGSNTTGSQNTAYGYEALATVNAGFGNTGIGHKALNVVGVGDYNTSVGRDSSLNLTSGNNNTAIGVGALSENSTGSHNVCIGYFAGFNCLGTGNVLIGPADSETSTDATYQPPSITGDRQLVIGSGDGLWIRGDNNFDVTIPKNFNVGQNLIVSGDLTINGTTTTINSNSIEIDDKTLVLAAVVTENVTATVVDSNLTITGVTPMTGIIEGMAVSSNTEGVTVSGTIASISGNSITLVNGSTVTGSSGSTSLTITGPSDTSADGGGLIVKGATDKTILWVDATDAWTLTEHLDIPSAKEYRVGNVLVAKNGEIGPASGTWKLNAGVTQADATIFTFNGTGAVRVPVGNDAARPTGGNEALGQIRFSTQDSANIFEGYNGTAWTKIGGSATVSSTAPSSQTQGDLWYDSDDGRLFIYYNDGSTSQWVDASPNGVPTDLVVEGTATFNGITTQKTRLNVVSNTSGAGPSSGIGILNIEPSASGTKDAFLKFRDAFDFDGTLTSGGVALDCRNSANTTGRTFIIRGDEIRLWTNSGDRFRFEDTVFRPGADNVIDLGSASARWANIYSADLQLSNEGSANEVDGTWGQYTIQEGEEDLFLINRRSGKKYKFMLQEVN